MNRAAQYQQERLRVAQSQAASSPEEYLAKLGIKVSIFAPATSDLPRFAQLVAKTNQFNLNCRRRSDVELTQMCADAGYLIRLVQARDDFGDYGIVGAFAAKLDSDRADLDIFLLSCRAMGRGIEDIQDELKLFPFRVAEDTKPGEVLRIKLGRRKFTPPEPVAPG